MAGCQWRHSFTATVLVLLCVQASDSSYEIRPAWTGSKDERSKPREVFHVYRLLQKDEEEEGDDRESAGEDSSGGKAPDQHAEKDEEADVVFTPMDLTCAICLLSFVSFNMCLYYLVNWPDPDMRIYVWTVISTTISIFIAIFIFSCTDLLLQMFCPGGLGWRAAMSFIELTLWFIIMQVSCCVISGGLSEKPFDIREPNEVGGKSKEQQIADNKIERKIGFKSIATLLAHVTGFAAINAGGCLQHMSPFNSSIPMRFAVPPLMFCGQLIIGRLGRMLRLMAKEGVISRRGRPPRRPSYSALNMDDVPSQSLNHDLIYWCLEQWDDEVYESELDIAGLAISFLTVQACRVSITGVMPDNMGIEERIYLHPSGDTLILGVIGVGFAILCVMFVIIHSYLPWEIEAGTLLSTWKRVVLTCQQAFAMAFAWSLFTCSKWEMARYLPQFMPNGVISRVLLALEISMIACFVIWILDKLADLEETGEVADRAIITLIGSLSTLVGFSFEQSFEGAVEALADLTFKDHKVGAELVLTILVVLIVYPAWKWHILRTLVNLREDYLKTQNLAKDEIEIMEMMT